MGLTKFANDALARMAPAHVDDLCNALAGMGFTERKEFVKAMVDRAPEPIIPPTARSEIEAWWERKLETGIMLEGRREEGWIRNPDVGDLTVDYIADTKRTGITVRGNATAMGRFLKSVLPKLKTSSRTVYVDVQAGEGDGACYRPGKSNKVKDRVRYYEMPAHLNARKFWELRYGRRRW